MKGEHGGMMNMTTAIRALEPLAGPAGLIVEPSELTQFRDPFAPPQGEWSETDAQSE
jgi:hypothetical protein